MKIKYSNYVDANKAYIKSMENIYRCIEMLIQVLRAVNSCGFIEGEAAEQWCCYTERISKTINIFQDLSNRIPIIRDDLLKSLDNDQKYNGDSILYDYSYPDLRDYSCEHFKDLRKHVEDSEYDTDLLNKVANGFENIGYSISNGWSKLWGGTGYDNSQSQNIKKTQNALLQWKDITKERLNTIETNINYTDKSIAKRVNMQNDLIKELYNYIEILIKPLQNSNLNSFSTEPYSCDLDSSFGKVLNKYNVFIDDFDITDEDVESFIYDPVSENFFDDKTEIIREYLRTKLNFETFMDAFNLFIFQMFNIAEGTILGKGDCEKYLIKAELVSLFDELSETEYYYPESYEKEQLNLAKKFFSELEDYGGDVYDFLNTHRYSDGKLILDGRTVEAKQFKEFFKKFGNAADILKYGDKGIDTLSKLFVDYQKNLAFLETIENNVELSEKMKEAFNEIRELYEKDLKGIFDNAISAIINVGLDVAYNCSVGAVIGKFKSTIGLIGSVTGANEITLAQYELMTYGYDELNFAEDAFKNSYDKLKNCDKNNQNYDSYMNDFKNSFSTYKVVLKRMFEKLAKASTGKWKTYYEYCSTQISKLNLDNYNDLNILEFDEWSKG